MQDAAFYKRDYLTHWVVVGTVVGVGAYALTKKEILLQSVCSLNLAVGLCGPLVLAAGDVPGEKHSLFESNFLYHSLPSFVAVILVSLLPPSDPCSLRSLVCLTFGFVLAYGLTPSKKSGKVLMQKVREEYRTPSPVSVTLSLFASLLVSSFCVQRLREK